MEKGAYSSHLFRIVNTGIKNHATPSSSAGWGKMDGGKLSIGLSRAQDRGFR